MENSLQNICNYGQFKITGTNKGLNATADLTNDDYLREFCLIDVSAPYELLEEPLVEPQQTVEQLFAPVHVGVKDLEPPTGDCSTINGAELENDAYDEAVQSPIPLPQSSVKRNVSPIEEKRCLQLESNNSESGESPKRNGRKRKYELSEPLANEEDEKRRKNAINAKKNRDQHKEKMENLMTENQKLKEKCTNLEMVVKLAKSDDKIKKQDIRYLKMNISEMKERCDCQKVAKYFENCDSIGEVEV